MINAVAVERDDALAYLPRRDAEHHPHRSIFTLAAGLHLVVQGRILLNHGPTVDDLYGPDDLLFTWGGNALALDHTAVMSWDQDMVEGLVAKHPELGMALLRLAWERDRSRLERLESFTLDMAPQRLARVILYLSSRFGKMGGGRVATMPAITHADLAKYVGTSRELISSHMNLMRRNGFIRYTRKEIEVNQDLRGYLNARPAEGD